jgi:hypothetical protein
MARPVDVEFAVNFSTAGIPHQSAAVPSVHVQGTHTPDMPRLNIAADEALLLSQGAVVATAA